MSTTNRINLASDLPNRAIEIAEQKPDVRQAFATTSGSSGDITADLSNANSSNQLLELGPGTYTISGSVGLGGSLTGIVGAGSDQTTIEISGIHEYLFGGVNCSIAVIEGVTFDMRGGGECGFGRFKVSDQGWFEDVMVRGQRDRRGNGTGRFSWMIEAVNSSATNFIHRFIQPDGDTHYASDSTVGHAIPFSSDPSHEGWNVWKECHVEGFTDNGYYTGNSSPGSVNCFWNCTAKDNRAGNFRVSERDIIVGGKAELTSNAPGQATGQGIAVDYPGDVTVIGCQFVGDSYSDLVQTRQEAGDLTLDRCLVHGTDSNGDLARFDGNSSVSIQGGWWLDEGGGGIDIEGASVSADSNWAYRGSINGSISINGQSVSSDAGLPDPQPFPEIHFDGVESGGGTDYGGGVGGWDSGGGGVGGFIDGSDSPGSRWGLLEERTAAITADAFGEVSVTVEPQWFNTGSGGTGTGGGTGAVAGSSTTPGVSGGQVDLSYDYVHQVEASEGAAAVQSALDGAATGEGVEVTGSGETEWTETVSVPDGVGLDISLDVTIVVPANNNLETYQSSGILTLLTNANRSGASDVTIRGGQIDFYDVDYVGPTVPVWLHNAENSQIRDTVVSGGGDHVSYDYRTFNIALTQCTGCGVYDSEGHDAGYDNIGLRGANTNCEVIGCGGTGGASGTIQAAPWGNWDIGSGGGENILFEDCWGSRIYMHSTNTGEWNNIESNYRIQTLGVYGSAHIHDCQNFAGTVLLYTLDDDQPETTIENMEWTEGGDSGNALSMGTNGGEPIGTVAVADSSSEAPTYVNFNAYSNPATIDTVETTNCDLSGSRISSAQSGATTAETLAFYDCTFDFSRGVTTNHDEIIFEGCTFNSLSESEVVEGSGNVQMSNNTFN